MTTHVIDGITYTQVVCDSCGHPALIDLEKDENERCYDCLDKGRGGFTFSPAHPHALNVWSKERELRGDAPPKSSTKTVMGAWAEDYRGIGITNRLVWVALRDSVTGEITVEGIQPDEQSEEMWTLFPVLAPASEALIGAVRRLYAGTAKPAKEEK